MNNDQQACYYVGGKPPGDADCQNLFRRRIATCTNSHHPTDQAADRLLANFTIFSSRPLANLFFFSDRPLANFPVSGVAINIKA